MKVFLAAIFCFVSFQVNSAVIKLAVITSEFDKNTSEFFLETNQQKEIDSLRYVTTMPNGGIFEDITVTSQEVLDDGAVLVVRNGHEAVRLQVENFSLMTGGTVYLNYLYSGVTGARQLKKLNLQLVNGQFQLFDGDKKVNRMFLRANRARIIGIIGIRSIETSFEK